MPTPYKRPLLNRLWPAQLPSRMGVFAILDSARDPRIYGAVDGCRLEKKCLFSGDIPWQLQMTAPYLVQLERDNPFTSFLLDAGWGNSWGIFLRSETGFEQLRRHLRGFLRVTDEKGRRLLFRYYDPRVLRVYLPTCWPAELETVFGPVDTYLMESPDPGEILEFRRQANLLASTPVRLGDSAAQPHHADQAAHPGAPVRK